MPTGAGETKALTNDGINHQWARWMPDGKRFVFAGNEAGRGVHYYIQNIAGGAAKAISPEGVDALPFAVSPDGQYVVGVGGDQKGYLYPTGGGMFSSAKGLDSQSRRKADQSAASLYTFLCTRLMATVLNTWLFDNYRRSGVNSQLLVKPNRLSKPRLLRSGSMEVVVALL